MLSGVVVLIQYGVGLGITGIAPASVSGPGVNNYLLPVCFVVCLLGVYPTYCSLTIYELCCQDSFWWYSEGGSFSLKLI